MESIMVKGRPEYIMTDWDFSRILIENVGDDCAVWFEERVNGERDDLIAELRVSPDTWCPGECDKLYKMQEAFESQLRDIEDAIGNLYSTVLKRPMTKGNAEILQALAKIKKLCD